MEERGRQADHTGDLLLKFRMVLQCITGNIAAVTMGDNEVVSLLLVCMQTPQLTSEPLGSLNARGYRIAALPFKAMKNAIGKRRSQLFAQFGILLAPLSITSQVP
jgi:hypothetical protein